MTAVANARTGKTHMSYKHLSNTQREMYRNLSIYNIPIGKYPIYILDIYRNYNCGSLINVIVRFVTIPS